MGAGAAGGYFGGRTAEAIQKNDPNSGCQPQDLTPTAQEKAGDESFHNLDRQNKAGGSIPDDKSFRENYEAHKAEERKGNQRVECNANRFLGGLLGTGLGLTIALKISGMIENFKKKKG